jgi:filamentous hemagglutinin
VGSAVLGASPRAASVTNSTTSVPVSNPQGVARAVSNGGNWSDGSLSQTMKKIAGPNAQITHTISGKTIYMNPITGASVVYDNAGNYFRVQSATNQYLDQGGNLIPNNVPLIGPNKTTQTGVPKGVRNGLTHFNNFDPLN